jgi:zinc/manganese transport system substrate-binding protein
MIAQATQPTGAVARRFTKVRVVTHTLLASIVGALVLAGCSSTRFGVVRPGTLAVVAAELQYGNVASQIGGKYVSVNSVERNPNTDPHSYEASPQVAAAVSSAQVVIENGLGYDAFMSKLITATPNHHRVAIDVSRLLGLPSTTKNPHLWYSPSTMPAVAHALSSTLGKLDPAHKQYFTANAERFVHSLDQWKAAIANLHATFPHAAVATTEPVADALLQAAHITNLTPFQLQADVMNGIDPSPQAVSQEEALIREHKVQALVYNQQVTDALTKSFITLANASRVPVVGVYETMPTPGYDYQQWMLAETHALTRAFATHQSTTRL